MALAFPGPWESGALGGESITSSGSHSASLPRLRLQAKGSGDTDQTLETQSTKRAFLIPKLFLLGILSQ